MEEYVISIKANRNITGKPCEEWRYAGYSSCYPCWSFHRDEYCKIFSSVESAEQWFNENKKYLFDEHWYRYKLDISTLGIRKVVYKKVASLSVQ